MADGVTLRRDAPHDVGLQLRARADDEEGGVCAMPRERVEDAWRPLGMRPVIEGERYGTRRRGAAMQSAGTAGPRQSAWTAVPDEPGSGGTARATSCRLRHQRVGELMRRARPA